MKLVCLNAEGDRHLDRIVHFLRKEQPDIVCLQEIFEDNLPELGRYLFSVFTPLLTLAGRKWGLATLANIPVTDWEEMTYSGKTACLTESRRLAPNHPRKLLTTTLTAGGKSYVISHTHFTWSQKGRATKRQLRDFSRMKKILESNPKRILCGDFNAPRGGAIHSQLCSIFKDCLPAHITSTLDPILHKAGGLEFVVDGLFTSTDYEIFSVRLHRGISDHQAIIATIA